MTKIKTSKRLTLSEKNKKFWKLSKPEQRVAIARDVIKQIDTGFYIAQQGTYLAVGDFSKNIVSEKFDRVLGSIKRQGGNCDVCGIGACFTSLVRLGDKVNTSDLISENLIESGDNFGDTVMKYKLKEVFTPVQLSMIECAFEKSTNFGSAPLEKRIAAENFGCINRFNSTERLISIMRNIIINKGEFKP